MRLINVDTLQLESFFHVSIPAYAILSHTWGPDEEEITFQDFQAGNTDKPGIGRFKLDASCRQAYEDGLQYIWNDTCCIDKTNSTELGEAINSMFKWYEHADRCYAYLQDVPHDKGHLFAKSRWFTRGWTLQELLAPRELYFFSSDWRPLGSRRDLALQVEKATGIPRHYLMGFVDIFEASIAQRMSWAANRETKRREDIAYSLLGIFGINMPMIYGQGDHAFMRLQEEIMRRTTDDSILAWGIETTDGEGNPVPPRRSRRGVLAKQPADFEHCGLVVSSEHRTMFKESFDSLGGTLQVRLPLYKAFSGDAFGILGCHHAHDQNWIVGIPLRAMGNKSSNTYIRPDDVPAKFFDQRACESAETVTIYIRKEQAQNEDSQRRYGFYIEDNSDKNLDIIRVHPTERWQRQRSVISADIDPETGKVKTQQTWVRLRTGNPRLEQDLVLLLELQAPAHVSTVPTPDCHLMVSDVTYELAWDAETSSNNLSSFVTRPDLLGMRAASLSEHAHVQAEIIMERIGAHPMFVVKITTSSDPKGPKSTVSWDAIANNSLWQSALIDIIRQQDVKMTQKTEVALKLDEQSDKIKPLISRLSVVEEQIRELEAEKTRIKVQLHTHETQYDTLTNTLATLKDDLRTLSAQKDSEVQWLGETSGEHDASWQDGVLRRLLDDMPPVTTEAEGPTVQQSTSTLARLLLSSIFQNQPGVLQFALEVGGGIPKSIRNGLNDSRTLVELAASRCDPAVVHTLLSHDPKPINYELALFSAARGGRRDVIRALLSSGMVDVNIKNLYNTTPLQEHFVKGKQEIETVQLFIDKGAHLCGPGFPLLHAVVWANDAAMLNLLLDNGASINARDGVVGFTPLQTAAAARPNTECTKVLLDRGADPNVQVNSRESRDGPLSLAAVANHVEAVRLLLQRGANVNSRNIGGKTPLSMAAERGRASVVKLLLDAGADINARDDSGMLAMSLAAREGHQETVEVLLNDSSQNLKRDSLLEAIAAAEAGRKTNMVQFLNHLAPVVAMGPLKARDRSTAALDGEDVSRRRKKRT